MRIIITSGPTREPIDDVRFITNKSSGKMGYALAKESSRRGHNVTLVSGPVSITTPENIKVINISTADQMIDSVIDELDKGADILISVAAIADYKPVKTDGKIKSGEEFILKLEKTRKLIKEVRTRYPDLFIVGFKAEYNIDAEKLIEIAEKRLVEDSIDMIIANDVSKNIYDSEETEVHIVQADKVQSTKRQTKELIAKIIMDTIEAKTSYRPSS